MNSQPIRRIVVFLAHPLHATKITQAVNGYDALKRVNAELVLSLQKVKERLERMENALAPMGTVTNQEFLKESELQEICQDALEDDIKPALARAEAVDKELDK